MSEKFDVIIIGAGPGGYVAAIRAAQLKLKVALIEENHLGGICLNWGCIPTKALLKSAEMNEAIKHASEYGFEIGQYDFDFAKIIARSRKVSEKLSAGIAHLMKKNKIKLYDARGKLNAPNQVRIFDKSGKTIDDLEASNIVIATGARARILPNIEPDGNLIWSYKEAMVPTKLPKSILVMGSGAIGMEFASFYNAFGCKVRIVELAEKILPVEDAEISALAQKEFEKKSLEFYLNSSVTKLQKGKDEVSVEILNQKTGSIEKITVERVISAVGILGNIENLGLEGTKIKVEKNHIVTDQFCETDEKGIYAIGDVASAPWLAHKASHEAMIAIEKIAGLHPHPIIRENIPGCTYTSPQIASIGLTEEKAISSGHKIKVGRFPFSANGKAIAIGKESGLVKTIFDQETGELLGAHLIGAEVTEMIQSFVIAKQMEATEEDIIRSIFPHPTLSEMIHESVLDAFDRAIHK